ncbi:MAG: GGDEF domain-containing protein [Oscillospiraceae bacterium]|nr:GGDEF domain-containing protein [Oscillospiraceae bacterium]
MIGNYRTVALCTCRIQDKESHDFISTLENTLAEIQCRLIIYNCSSYIQSGKEDADAKLSVFKLIDPSFVDAVIIQADRFNNNAVCRKIIDDVLDKELPVIALGGAFENCFNITYNHQAGFAEIVSHLITQHNVTDFHLIAGLRNNIYSDERIETFRNVLEENNLPFDENMVSYGDFWPGPAQRAVKKLIRENSLPRALVCANDNMAIAVVALLNNHGIAVPDDVIVTGFDCIDAIYSAEPTITSACIGPDVSSRVICNILADIFSGKKNTGTVSIPSVMITNDSCGCKGAFKTNATAALSEQHSRFCIFQDENISLSESGAKIQKCENFSEVVELMKECFPMQSMGCLIRAECIYKRTDLNSISTNAFGDEFFLLYDSDAAVQQTDTDENASCFISSEDFIFKFEPHILDGCSFIVSPLYYLDVPMGFVYFHFKERTFSNYYKIPQIVNVLNNALGGMINLRHTRYLMKQIDEMYRNDPLTGLYNRRGFCIEYEKFLENNNGIPLSVVMCDLDGLKKINDTWGHEEGDIAIHTIAQALKHASGNDSLCTRMGGDEMLAVYVYKKGSDAKFRSEFNSYLDKFNKVSGKSYSIAASTGIYHTSPDERLSFEELIKRSDVLMYAEKKRRKQQK